MVRAPRRLGALVTRRDFELIAATIKAGRYAGMTPLRAAIANDEATRFAAALATTNPAFDRARFLKACGYVETPIEVLRRAD